ncbi:membrane-associated protein, putative [Bodo saltans]|uniref:Membrane-associated protein, putative n=1 Tax=Bodo saltans TaxID=75058 RepID=A0A0S4JNE0_BODSA|nr:membrane-associated protein, putative [Bodo saltans]|eukprot:CUG92165.1 membrane-associated protein, putative [Bodo saltans]
MLMLCSLRWLVLFLLGASELLQGCSISSHAASTPVPVTVSTLFHSNIFVNDLSVDGAGVVLVVSASRKALFQLAENGITLLLAGSVNGSSGFQDGIGSEAMFSGPRGIACDNVNRIVYVSDYGNSRVRSIALSTANVTTLAGSGSVGNVDGIGTRAQFYGPYGVTYHSLSEVLYITDFLTTAYVRRIVISTGNVSTITSAESRVYYFLCVNSAGTFLYVTTPDVILEVNVSSGTISTLAGRIGATDYANGHGSAALFNVPLGIALNGDESALIIADENNHRIRKLELATTIVTTIAGSGQVGSINGPGLTALFDSPYAAKWNCNVTMGLCGVLVVDYNSQFVRFVSVEKIPTLTMALSEEATGSTSISRVQSFSLSSMSTMSLSPSNSRTLSPTCIVFSMSLSGTVVSSSSVTRSLAASSSSVSRNETVSEVKSQSATNVVSFSSNVSTSNSATAWLLSTSYSSVVTASNNSVDSTATTPLSTSLSASRATRSALQSNSRSLSRSGDSKSHSHTGNSSSASVTAFCALVPADGQSSVGSLQPLNVSVMPEDAIPIINTLTTSSGWNDTSVAPLSRVSLLRSVPLGVNLSLFLGGTIRGGSVDGWGLVRVTVNVLPVAGSSAFPFLTAVVPYTLLSNDIYHRTQQLLLLIFPPNATAPARWLPTSLSAFTDLTLSLQLSLSCPTEQSITIDVIVEVPCPGEVQPLASEVKIAGRVAQFSSSFVGPAAGSAVGRLTSVRSLVLCSESAVTNGLMPLEVGTCDSAGTVATSARGNIVGNLVLWAIVCAVMVIAVALYSHLGRRTTLTSAAAALGVPSQLLPLVVVTVPSTTSSTFYLLHASTCSADGVIAALGVVMCIVPIAMLCSAAYIVPRRCTLVRCAPKSGSSGELNFSSVFHRHWRWRELRMETNSGIEAQEPYTWLRAATVLLLDYSAVWFACVDLVVLTASSSLGALSVVESAVACRGGAIGILVLYVMQLLLCAVVRPFTTLLSHVYAMFTLVLSCITVACQVWYMHSSIEENVNPNTLHRLLVAAAVCDLLVSGVSILKLLFDAVDVAKATRRHFNALLLTTSSPRRPRDLLVLHTMEPLHLEAGFDDESAGHVSLSEECEFNGLILPVDEEGYEGDVASGIFTARESAAREISDLERIYGSS